MYSCVHYPPNTHRHLQIRSVVVNMLPSIDLDKLSVIVQFLLHTLSNQDCVQVHYYRIRLRATIIEICSIHWKPYRRAYQYRKLENETDNNQNYSNKYYYYYYYYIYVDLSMNSNRLRYNLLIKLYDYIVIYSLLK